MPQDTRSASHFEHAAKKSRHSLAREFLGFVKYYKKWWLLPIIVVMVMVGALRVFAQ